LYSYLGLAGLASIVSAIFLRDVNVDTLARVL
jgi:hypothetical protein